MSFAEMEGISGLNTLAIISQDFVCAVLLIYLFLTSQLTDSYDFQMGEQECV